MLLRNLSEVELKKLTKEKQPNGFSLETYSLIRKYSVQEQELNDEISLNVYGSSIFNMLRIKTPTNDLEAYLKAKINNTEDNISQYFIFIDNKRYKVVSVTKRGIDIELV